MLTSNVLVNRHAQVHESSFNGSGNRAQARSTNRGHMQSTIINTAKIINVSLIINNIHLLNILNRINNVINRHHHELAKNRLSHRDNYATHDSRDSEACHCQQYQH